MEIVEKRVKGVVGRRTVVDEGRDGLPRLLLLGEGGALDPHHRDDDDEEINPGPSALPCRRLRRMILEMIIGEIETIEDERNNSGVPLDDGVAATEAARRLVRNRDILNQSPTMSLLGQELSRMTTMGLVINNNNSSSSSSSSKNLLQPPVVVEFHHRQQQHPISNRTITMIRQHRLGRRGAPPSRNEAVVPLATMIPLDISRDEKARSLPIAIEFSGK
jgi:hypothetical protein